MNRSWWRDLPGSAKFRLYTRLTLQVSTVAVALWLAVSAGDRWAGLGMVLSGLAGVALIEVQPGLASAAGARVRRPVVAAGIAVPALLWVVFAVAAQGDREQAAAVAGFFAAVVLALAVLPFVPHRWWWLVAGSIATGLAYGDSWPARFTLGALLLVVGVVEVGSMLLTLSGQRIVDDLDRARTLEARLRVADERLRFSRDLHDVVGRGFSAVAVKSELAATLARAGAADRAATEMDEVKTLAVESMEQMRRLVRGYRDIDLEHEVAGARSLLAAIGCRLVVEGDPAALPDRFHEVAAWATREGTTNILKHATATSAVLAFGTAGMSLRNDGVHGEPNERSGLRGLAERAEQTGAGLRAGVDGEDFVLEIVWTPR